uniref:b(0,+)-type amino acid transporter 1 n=1 Tax=Anser brachyrhynchus TaxID=132585 RepID=A0A8B9CPP4_9AVES
LFHTFSEETSPNRSIMRKRKTTHSPHSPADPSEGREKLRLKQEVGLISGVSLIAGTMIGSGIFMSPEWVLHHMGSPASSLLIWAACGVLATFGALSYAELGTVIKESGGEYIYILRIFGSFPAFLFAYTSVILVRPAGLAAVCLSFAEYAVAPFYPGCSSPQVVVKCAAAACILVLTIINCLNVRLATSIMNVFTAAKLLALLVIVVGGLALLAKGQTQSFQNAFQNTTAGIGTVGVAFYQGLWSYDGWNNLNYVTEELKKPEVTLPRAVMIAIPLVTCLYLMVNVSYFAAMTPSELLTSGAVAVTWGDKVLGRWAWLISLSVALSTFGSSNGTFFSGGRVCYIAAREGHMPDILSMAHVRCLTPSPALLFTSAMSLAGLTLLYDLTPFFFSSFIAWFFYGMTISGLLYLKIKKPELPRSYKIEFLYIVLFIFSGVILYFPLVRFKCHPRFLQRVTLHLQLFLEVAPTARDAN